MEKKCLSCGRPLAEGASVCPQCGTRVTSGSVSVEINTQPLDRGGVLLSHLGGLFFSFVPALLVFLMKADTPGPVQDNAREALNWQLSVLLYYFVAFLLMVIWIGAFLFPVLYVMNMAFCIIAAIKSGKAVYRYPLTVQFIKKSGAPA
jgi:uncharacterized protein